jgi:hypothetical protein
MKTPLPGNAAQLLQQSKDFKFEPVMGMAWHLDHKRQMDDAIKLINFGPDIPDDQRRWYVEGALVAFEGIDDAWRLLIQPDTRESKKAARQLSSALHRVEVAMKNPNLSPSFRTWDFKRELHDLRLRATEAASKEIGSKKIVGDKKVIVVKEGGPQRETARKKWAVRMARDLLYHSVSDAKKFERFVKLANLIYNGKAKVTANFERLCKEVDLDSLEETLGLTISY